ncbi:hypothetical protein FRB99_007163 [Tulasnella sp. 403]|nr:hypothetical protein FRB99_007163 [Tulasnella sp. 403]
MRPLALAFFLFSASVVLSAPLEPARGVRLLGKRGWLDPFERFIAKASKPGAAELAVELEALSDKATRYLVKMGRLGENTHPDRLAEIVGTKTAAMGAIGAKDRPLSDLEKKVLRAYVKDGDKEVIAAVRGLPEGTQRELGLRKSSTGKIIGGILGVAGVSAVGGVALANVIGEPHGTDGRVFSNEDKDAIMNAMQTDPDNRKALLEDIQNTPRITKDEAQVYEDAAKKLMNDAETEEVSSAVIDSDKSSTLDVSEKSSETDEEELD